MDVCLTHLNRRAAWIDQLNGFSHELRSSFAVVEERVKNSLLLAQNLLHTWREHSEQAQSLGEAVTLTRPSDNPAAQTNQQEQILNTLEDLQVRSKSPSNLNHSHLESDFTALDRWA